MRRLKRWCILIPLVLTVPFVLPERPRIPVAGATPADWNPATFWYAPWGASGVHKGIDIFARLGTPVIAPTYGLVLFSGEIERGGQVVLLLGPRLRLHYFAHLASAEARIGTPVRTGQRLGTVGNTGNAKGKPPHLHYSVLTLIPYPWRADRSPQGWKKMFYLNPIDVLR